MMKLIVLVIGIACAIQFADCAVRRRYRGKSVVEQRDTPNQIIDETSRTIRSSQIPVGKTLLKDAMIGSVMLNQVRGSRLISTNPTGLVHVPAQLRLPIISRLTDNATLIRSNIVDTFTCDGRKYGYYADQDNGCQVFHVCLNFNQIWPDNFTSPLSYQFSFICNKYTIFSQDSMTCAWSQEAVPCEQAHHLYSLNDEFFKIPVKTENAVGSGSQIIG